MRYAIKSLERRYHPNISSPHLRFALHPSFCPPATTPCHTSNLRDGRIATRIHPFYPGDQGSIRGAQDTSQGPSSPSVPCLIYRSSNHSLPLSFTLSTPQQEREKRVSKFEDSGLTQEELYEQQQALFAKSKAAFDAQSGAPGPSMT